MSEASFKGFEFPSTTPVPDIIFDELLGKLTGNELKVLLYIVRRTYGFGKNADAISLSQFRKGITTQDGKVLDTGCGIEHNRTILVALASLEAKGYIESIKRKTKIGDDDTTVYKLKFSKSGKGTPEACPSTTVVTSGNYPSLPQVTTVVTSHHDGSYSTSLPVVTSSNPQETVIQETVIQETERESDAPTNTQPPTFDVPIVTSAPSQDVSSEDKQEIPDEEAMRLFQEELPNYDATNKLLASVVPVTDVRIAPTTAPDDANKQEEKPTRTRKKATNAEQERIDRVFATLSEAFQSIYDNPDFQVVPSRKATDAVKDLLKANALPSILKLVVFDMWKEYRNGEYWWRGRGRMTIPAICEQYTSRAPGLMPKVRLVKADESKTESSVPQPLTSIAPESGRPELVVWHDDGRYTPGSNETYTPPQKRNQKRRYVL